MSEGTAQETFESPATLATIKIHFNIYVFCQPSVHSMHVASRFKHYITSADITSASKSLTYQHVHVQCP